MASGTRSVVASVVFLLATGLPSHGWAATESVPAPGTVDWVIAFDAARKAAEEKVGSPEELIARFERLVSLYDGCPRCREYYYGILAYRLDHEFHERAATVLAMERRSANDPIGLVRMYLWERRFEDAAQAAIRGLETVAFVEQRTELLQTLAQARKAITTPPSPGESIPKVETGVPHHERYAPLDDLRSKLSALVAAKETDEAGEVARELIARFPDSIAACQACEADWASFAQGRDLPEPIHGWLRGCRSIAARCPERLAMWSERIRLLPEKYRKSSLELLLASELPDEVKPLLLLYLASAIRPADPEGALELERQAIVHPQYFIAQRWGISGTFSKDRFERRGDIRSALFLELFEPRPDPRCSGAECSLMRSHTFRVAYYKLLLGMESEQQWARMMEIMPSSPEAEGASLFHTHEYLDRFVAAARVAHQEAAAATWLRGLEALYAERVQRPGGRTASMYMPSPDARRTMRELQLTVAGTIDELENPSAECETRNEATIDPIGLARASGPPAAEHRDGPIDLIPKPGSIEWALALVAARDAARTPSKTAKELVEHYEPLLALNRDCTMCRRQLLETIRYKLKSYVDSSTELDRIDERFADTPLDLSRVLMRTGRFDDAYALALREMKKSEFVDDRLRWVEVLAETSLRLGNTREAERLVHRLRKETPVSSEYCTKVSKWYDWFHESPVPAAKTESIWDLGQSITVLRALQSNAGTDPVDSCRLNEDLVNGGRFGLKDFQELFPEGAQAAQLDLARKTRDPKTRAAILLSAAGRWRRVLGQPAVLALIRQAESTGPDTEIQVGALRQELAVLSLQSQSVEKERWRALPQTVIARFPTYEASCMACEQYWYATISGPDASQEIPLWWKSCGTLMDRCPDRIELWTTLATSLGRTQDMMTAEPPPEAVPRLLLSRSDAIRSAAPQRALELEREAIRHPQYPGSGDTYGRERQKRAEDADDFETVLYLELLPEPSMIGGCIPGDRSTQVLPQFRAAYYKARLGIEPKQECKALIELMPTSPDDPTSNSLHQTEHFERVAKAASAAHEESAAIAWFRLVRGNYAELNERRNKDELATTYLGRDPRELELLLGGYIRELHASLCGTGTNIE